MVSVVIHTLVGIRLKYRVGKGKTSKRRYKILECQ